jgi:hypothetical protein
MRFILAMWHYQAKKATMPNPIKSVKYGTLFRRCAMRGGSSHERHR